MISRGQTAAGDPARPPGTASACAQPEAEALLPVASEQMPPTPVRADRAAGAFRGSQVMLDTRRTPAGAGDPAVARELADEVHRRPAPPVGDGASA